MTVLPLLCLLTAVAAVAAGQDPPEEAVAGDDSVAVLDTLYFLDVDTSLLTGQGVLLAFEDTIPFAEGTLDTVLASAPRVKVSEVVRLIGERMEEDWTRIKEHSYTGVTKAVARHGSPSDEKPRFVTYEQAERFHKDPNGDYQRAVLWQREQEFEDGQLVEEDVEDEVDVHWEELSGAVVHAIPFSLGSGHEYNYQILDRQLIGMNVIYKIGYEPKSRFKALSSGVVWIDYGDMMIRRVEAEMTGTVPLPLFIRSIPVIKFRKVRKGDFWVISDLYARVELRQVPLLDIPGSIEFYYQTSRHVINGEEFPDSEPEPDRPSAGGR